MPTPRSLRPLIGPAARSLRPPIQRRLQSAARRGPPYPGPAGRVYLDQPPRVDHVLDLLRGHRPDEYAALRVQRDEALGLQAQQGFPHGGTGDSDARRDLGLAQQRPVGVDPLQDRALEVLVHAGGGGRRDRIHDAYKICHAPVRRRCEARHAVEDARWSLARRRLARNTLATSFGFHSAVGGATSCCTDVKVRRTSGSTWAASWIRRPYRLNRSMPGGFRPVVSG